MDILAESRGKLYGALSINGPEGFTWPYADLPFPCLIWDHVGRLPGAARSAIASALLKAGCRYAVCGGADCEAWHDAVDEELVVKSLEDADEVQAAVQVMTTWHTGESPDEVAFHFVVNTDFDDVEFRRYLVLHVGSGPAKAQVDSAVRNYALNDEAV